MALPFVKRSNADAAQRRLRSAYDRSIADAALLLMKQTAAGQDSHHASVSCRDLLGWDPLAFLEPGCLRSIVHVDDLPAFREVASNLDGEAPVIRLLHADGSYRHFRFGVSHGGLGEPLTFALVDVSNDAAARATRLRSEELVQRSSRATLTLHLTDGSDPGSFTVSDLNPAAQRLLRRTHVPNLTEVFAQRTLHLLHNAAFDVAHTGESVTFSRLTIDEMPECSLDIEVSRLHDGTIALTLDDVSVQVTTETHLRDLAMRDQRTGLANLALLEERIGELQHTGAKTLGALAVELSTADADDRVVLAVAERLGSTIPTPHLVARTGPQRLAVLLEGLSHHDELAALSQSVTAAIAIPFEVNGAAVDVQAVVGAAATDTEARGRLLAAAEVAARRAMADHVPWLVTDDDDLRPAGLFHDVRVGVGNGKMELRYQPLLDLRSGKPTKVEALLRWMDHERGSDSSLELAERSGIPDVLPKWVIGEATGASRWLDDSGFDQVVAINLGAATAVEELDGLVSLLAADGQHTHGRLEVEVPEAVLTDDPMRGAEMVRRLHAMGMTVTIDDFGAGFTSLRTVSDLDVDGLKIDRSFISTIGAIPADAAVVRSTIEFCHEIGIEVTAIGVNDAATLEVLTEMGCDLVQGSHICEPVNLSELPTRVAGIRRARI
ncbi:MAG: EAL domain-containing protein [Microthrixaceae bacterium]